MPGKVQDFFLCSLLLRGQDGVTDLQQTYCQVKNPDPVFTPVKVPER